VSRNGEEKKGSEEKGREEKEEVITVNRSYC